MAKQSKLSECVNQNPYLNRWVKSIEGKRYIHVHRSLEELVSPLSLITLRYTYITVLVFCVFKSSLSLPEPKNLYDLLRLMNILFHFIEPTLSMDSLLDKA
jgi:hypothetical protein